MFVTFFPQLIAGPIVLPAEMLSQFENEENKKINWENMNKGIYIFSIGIAKKVIIADAIAHFANAGFDMMESLNFVEAWLTSMSYTLQLYFDFSGYCDMAMGIGMMFNIMLPINFNSPYKSTNIQEFWRKWHITLGRFMTNYLYIPLGGNRKGELKTLRNLFIVFLTSGIWHGAGWNFVIWGMLHGICILIHRIWKRTGKKLPKLVGWFITINFVNIFWVFFRAVNIDKALVIIKSMFNLNELYLPKRLQGILQCSFFRYGEYSISVMDIFSQSFFIIILIIIILFFRNSYEKMVIFKEKNINLVMTGIFLFFSLLYLNNHSEFLYFNF